MKSLFTKVGLSIMFLWTTTLWGQQLIGQFPQMDGGFEGQTGTLVQVSSITSEQTAWTTQMANTGTVNTTSGRSGPKYLIYTQTGTTHRRLQSPTASLTPSTSYVVQFFYKGDMDGTIGGDNLRVAVSAAGTGSPGTYSAYLNSVNTGDVWTKFAEVVSTSSTAPTVGLGIISVNNTATFYIDDFVIYQATEVDNTPPSDPGAVIVSNPTNSSLDISWSAAPGGVDGGGYVVVRFETAPDASWDPNQNGIYALGNIIPNGGVVCYIGTATSFTDNGLNSNTQYWYKVYTVDKAFNYSNESVGNGTTSGSAFAVTFRVDMSNAAGFNPVTDDVYISGEFPTWQMPGSNLSFKMTPLSTGSKIYTLTLNLTAGTYEYKYFRVISGNPSWDNGEPIGGNRSLTVSSSATVDNVWGVNAHPVIGWANLQWPGSGSIEVGELFNVYAQVWIDNVTTANNPYEMIKAWIGYKNTNTNPSTWNETDWVPAVFNGKTGNNHEYVLNLGALIPYPGTYYYASRFQFGNGSYYYGGFNSGAWDGTNNISGVLTVTQNYTVTFSVIGGNGILAATVDGNAISSGATVQAGKSVQFTATPNSGYQVKEWVYNTTPVSGNTSNSYVIASLNENATVTVEFEPIPSTYVVTFSVVGGNGTLSAFVEGTEITSGYTVQEGKTVLFRAYPFTKYQVKEWTLNGTLVSNNTNFYTVSSLQQNVTVTVEFQPQALHADLLFVEDFDYPQGALLTNYGWTAHSGAGTNAINVVAPGLSYSDYIGSSVGNAATMTNTGEDVSIEFASQNSGAVYTAFMVNFSNAQTATAGDYFIHYLTMGTTTFRGRVFVRRNDDNKLSFGVTRGGNGSNAVWSNYEYDLNTTYLMVLKYAFVDEATNDEVSLYINPVVGAPEPSPTITISGNNPDNTSDITDLNGIALRQGSSSSASFQVIDGIRVAKTWEQAVKSNIVPNYEVTFSVIGANGTLTAEVDGITINSGDYVEQGKNVIFIATPNSGYQVKEWRNNGNIVSGHTANVYTIISLNQTVTVNVEFEEIPTQTFTVTYGVIGGNGTLTATVNGDAINSGTAVLIGRPVIFTATPNPGYRIKQWTNNGVIVDGNTSNQYIIPSLQSDVNVTVEFEVIPQYTLSIIIVGEGTVTVNGQVYSTPITANEGATFNLQATPNSGWTFNGWTGDLVSTDNPLSMVLTQDISITATFHQIPILTTVVGWNFDDENTIADLGIPANATREIETNTGGTISYTTGVSGKAITSNQWGDGENVKYWIVDFTTTGFGQLTVSSTQRSSSTGPRDFKLQYKVEGFDWQDLTQITVANNFTSGTVTNFPLPAICNNQGKVYLRWIMTSNTAVNEGPVANAGTNRIDNIIVSGYTIPGAQQYVLTLSKVGLGTIIPAEGTYTLNAGTEITLQATPAPDQVFAGWTGDLISNQPTEIITMDGNKTIVANFRQFVPATINPTSANYYESNPENISTVITWNDASSVTLITILYDGAQIPLEEGEDYTITPIDSQTSLLTFLTGAKMNSKNADPIAYPFTIHFNVGSPVIFTIYFHPAQFNVTFMVSSGGQPLAGAQIQIDGRQLITDQNGSASVQLVNGSYPYEIQKTGYNTVTGTVEVADQDVEIYVVMYTGIDEYGIASMNLYPNPANDRLTLTRNDNTPLTLEIYTTSGVRLLTQILDQTSLTLDISGLDSGVYLMRLTNGRSTHAMRFVKQ